MSTIILSTKYSPECYYSGQLIRSEQGFNVIITNDSNGNVVCNSNYNNFTDAKNYMNARLAKIDNLYHN